MLNGGRAHLLDAPHLTIFPGLAIALLVLGFNFLGDGLRDLTDPEAAGCSRGSADAAGQSAGGQACSGSIARPRSASARAPSRSPDLSCASASDASSRDVVGLASAAARRATAPRSRVVQPQRQRCDARARAWRTARRRRRARCSRSERVPRGVEVVLPLGGGRVVRGTPTDRPGSARRLLQHLLGGVELVVAQQRAAVQRQHVARGAGIEATRSSASSALLSAVAIVARLGDVEPDLAERAVDERLVRRALERAAEREDRQLGVARRAPAPGRPPPAARRASRSRPARPAAARARRRAGLARRTGRPALRGRR